MSSTLQILCPHCAANISIDDQFSGETLNCPLCEGAYQVPYPSSARRAAAPVSMPTPRSYRRELTGLRCYDCGDQIYEDEHVRRTIETGSSSWIGMGSSTHGTWDQLGLATHSSRVDLCLACSQERDRKIRLAYMLVASAGLAALFILGIVFLVLRR